MSQTQPLKSSAPNAVNPPAKWRSWILAVRLPTLPAALVPVAVGSATALAASTFRPWVFIAAAISSLFLQIGTNLANDLFDFQRGADTAERVGPTRVTQSGLLSPGEVRTGMWLSFALAFLVGMYLVYVGGWPILAIGILAIISGVAYTGGPFPLAYHGLGDVFAFLFFGVIAVMGTHFVHTGDVNLLSLTASLPVACLVTGILVVNNYRDIETDRKAGKRTLAVRIGRAATRGEYAALVLAAYLVPLWLALATPNRWAWLPLLTAPMAFKLVRALFTQTGPALNPVLMGTGKLHLFHGVLFALGLAVGGA